MTELRRTPLYDLHIELGARMVPFAGWEMPVQYPMGVLGEHLHTRKAAGLFDVSHMGQVILRGEDAAQALERLVPADITGLARGRQRYGLFTNDKGGILDDLMVAAKGDHLLLVVNAACAEQDIAHMTEAGLTPEVVTDRALLALQGPGAEAALAALVPAAADLRFMDAADLAWDGGTLWVEAEPEDEADRSERSRRTDGVSSIVVTSNDLASAWALDESNRPVYAAVPGGEVQREMAFRAGVNLVMYALTGNYKADQVHVPALLERLGQ